MFVRRVKRSNGVVSVRIVETYKNSKKRISQRVIRTIGSARTEAEIQVLERTAKEILLMLDPKKKASLRKNKKPVSSDVALNNVVEVKRVNEGIFDIFGSVYD